MIWVLNFPSFPGLTFVQGQRTKTCSGSLELVAISLSWDKNWHRGLTNEAWLYGLRCRGKEAGEKQIQHFECNLFLTPKILMLGVIFVKKKKSKAAWRAKPTF